ncbi:MAG: dihydroneopterin aldolase [Muribaculaceae bacterium]
MGRRQFEIALSSLRFHAFHGLLPLESKVGNEFIVDISVKIPYNEEIAEDNIEGSVNYAELYEIVRNEMNLPKKLMETVAARIADHVSRKFPQIIGGSITICKSTPPIPGITGCSKITLDF